MSDLVTAVNDGVFSVTINRPEKRNPLSREVLADLKSVFDEHASDESIKLAVIRGAGDAAFAAGGDLKDLEAIRTPDDTRDMHELGYAALQALRVFPAPVVAAVNGDALGGGAELAVAADLRIAAKHARIGFLQARLNITTAWGGASDLFELVGQKRALRLLCTAEVLSADEALAMGLYDQCAEEEFDDGVERFADTFRKMSARVVRGYKAMALESRTLGRRDLRPQSETEHFVEAWTHDDHWAAAARALKKS